MILASKSCFGALLAGALFFSAPLAFAEDAEMRTAARDLATQGAQAFDAGKYAEASDFFRRAYELVPAPSIALLRARSLAKVGQLLEAIDIYEQTSRLKLADDAPEAYAQAVQTAHSEVEEVRHRLPRLKLTLLGIEPNQPMQVTIDERPVPDVLLGVERPMNPGQHVIVVRVAGQPRATRELAMVESESYRVELDIGPAKPVEKPIVAAPLQADTDTKAHASPPWRTLGYVGLGVGVVGIGVGTITGLAALKHKSSLDDACKPDCPASSAGDIDSFRSNRTISWISYGVGIAAAATGVVLLTLGKPEQEHVALRALPGGLQIGGQL